MHHHTGPTDRSREDWVGWMDSYTQHVAGNVADCQDCPRADTDENAVRAGRGADTLDAYAGLVSGNYEDEQDKV